MTKSDIDEISIREVLIRIHYWITYVISKWPVVIITSFIFSLLGYLNAISHKPTYKGKLTFVITTESRGNGLSGFANQLGIDLGSSNSDAFSSQNNILGLMSSQKILKKVLLKKIPDTDENLANIVAKESGVSESWQKLNSSKTIFTQNLSEMTPRQDSLLRELCEIVSKNYLILTKPEKNEFFFTVSVTSSNEIIAVYLPKYIVDETASLYVETKTAQARKNLNMLQFEADSLKRQLGGSIAATSNSLDKTFNLNPALQARRSSIQEGHISTTLLSAAYAEVLKNLEIAKINLQRDTPLYQVIDSPEMPLKIQNTSRRKYIVLGFGVGFLFCVSFLIIRKYITDNLRKI